MHLPLYTERLLLRAFAEEDLPAFVAYRSDPKVARHQSWNAPYTETHAQSFLSAMKDTVPGEPDAWYQLAIALRATGQIIGDCAFCVMAERPHEAEIGFTLASEHQRHGYGLEAVRALLEYLFDGLGMNLVCANCDSRNERSALLLTRLGLLRVGPEQRQFFKGEWCVEWSYALSRVDWAETRQPRIGQSCSEDHNAV